jgi:hypothetical protein
MDEAEAVDALTKASTRDLFPHFYNATQIASSVRYVASVDRTLIEEETKGPQGSITYRDDARANGFEEIAFGNARHDVPVGRAGRG